MGAYYLPNEEKAREYPEDGEFRDKLHGMLFNTGATTSDSSTTNTTSCWLSESKLSILVYIYLPAYFISFYSCDRWQLLNPI